MSARSTGPTWASAAGNSVLPIGQACSARVAASQASATITFCNSQRLAIPYGTTLQRTTATMQVKVFELLPPLVNTEFPKEIGGENDIPLQQVAIELVAGLEQDTPEILVGQTAQFYEFHRASPTRAFAAMNQG